MGAAIVENAWNFLTWLMARPERDIAVVTHSIFLLALFHGSLDASLAGCSHEATILFHTGELRSVWITETAPRERTGSCLAMWAKPLIVDGLMRADRSRSPKSSRLV